MSRLIFFAALLTFVPVLRAEPPSAEANATVVVYNSSDAASRKLAEYYAKKRSIPPSQLVGLACSNAEEITRDEFLVDIESPLRAQFTKAGWWKVDRDESGRRFVAAATVRFVAIMRGVPLKIRSKAIAPAADGAPEPPPKTPMEMLSRHDEASVDSELAAMFAPGHELGGPVENPYYRRFSPVLQVPPSGSPLLVSRLDGPSDAIVRRMIDDSLATERTGLWGWAYLDGRNITSGAYAVGDEWINAAGAMMLRQGIPVIADYAPETLPLGFPVTDAAIYYGWYETTVNGPFANPNFHFVPGAIAVHLHSYSAMTLRNPRVAWAAPLLARGAAATLGNVYEPFLELTVHFDILQDRLMSGLTLAESAYAASRVVSWMGIVVGDPLYRPYASHFSNASENEEQNPWAKYREVVLAGGKDPVAAAEALRKLAQTSGESMPLEALGQAQAVAGDFDAALDTLAAAAKLAKTKSVRLRLALEQIDILRRANRIPEAKQRIAAALAKFVSDEDQSVLGRVLLAIEPKVPEPPAKNP